ncbi:MAG TPA: YHYH protein, partial [Flavobacteriales bacterium]|nr:YHYH protein [Flavobacteriales bacterium]
MKKILFLFLLPFTAFSQGVNITSWSLNTTGHQAQYYTSTSSIVDLNDSSEVLQVCYNDDTIYVRTNMLASYIMGDWPGDPFVCDGQNASYIFKRNPTYPSSTHGTKNVGLFGLAINGVALYDDGDGKSYNSTTGTNNNTGAGVWNQIAWVAHADEMDSGNAHPDPNNIYHHHHNPIQLCSVTDNTAHSPIIGWAFDGWPIYGPFGYSDSLDNTSPITRMTPSWQLRSITTRTTLYDGSAASQVGPNVSASFPLGTYIEDYEYTSGLGELDYYNGRYCVTPEFPSGTYAYFLNVDASGNAQYPNFVGPSYYGTIYPYNTGPFGGTSDMLVEDVQCYNPSASLSASLSSSTNPTCNGSTNGSATVSASGGTGTYSYSWSPSGGSAATATGLGAGTYTCTVSDGSFTTTVSVTLTTPATISITGTVTNPTCSSSTNGAVDITVSGGTAYDSSNPGLVISEVHANPSAASDSPFEFVELVATKDIDFTSTPYTVVFSNNGTATTNGWINGGNITYAFEISSGSATQGQVVYVGGTSMTPASNILKSINTGTSGGSGGIGNANASGVLGNGGANADAVAVFSTGTSGITSSTVPVDAIFFGTGIGSAVVSGGSAGYQLPVNDKYPGGKLQASSYFASDPVSGQYLRATGAYNLQTDAWTTTRTWANTSTFTNLATSVSLSGPYTYSWSSGPATQDLSSLGGGTYTVTVTDAIGCTNNASFTVTAPSAVTGTTSVINVSCFGNSTGAVDLTPSGGNGAYTYSWSNSATTQDISSLAAGTYSVTITDGNSCTGTASATVTQPSAVLSVSGTTTSTGCSTSVGAVNITVSGGTSSYTYSWSNGATTEDISSLSAGTYTVTVTDANGCTTTGTYTVSSTSGPFLSTSVTNVLCNGGSTGAVNLTVTGGTGSMTYAWSNSATTEDITSVAAGTYSVTVTDAASCTATTSVTVTQPAALSASSSSTSILCNGGSSTVTVSASGGTALYSGTGTFTQTVGTYSYTVTDANGCTASTSITITEPTALTASSSATSILCNGGSSTV